MRRVNDRHMFTLLARLIDHVDMNALDPETVKQAIDIPHVVGQLFTALLGNKQLFTLMWGLTREIDMDQLDPEAVQQAIGDPHAMTKHFMAMINRRLELVIDWDAMPIIPDGCEVIKHESRGRFAYDLYEMQFYLTGSGSRWSTGADFLREPINRCRMSVGMNASLLDFLMVNQVFINHRDLQRYTIFFPATVFRDQNGAEYIGYMHWTPHDGWQKSYCDLSAAFEFGETAIVYMARHLR